MTKMENNKKTKIGFYISTGLVSALMLMSASMYVFNHEMVATSIRDGNGPLVVFLKQ